MDKELLLKDKDYFIDLLNRLTLDYNGDKAFEQHEEDRLIVGHIVDMLCNVDTYKKAYNDYMTACKTFNGKTYKECLNILNSDYAKYSITNELDGEYIDFFYGACCLTLSFERKNRHKARVSDYIEVWGDCYIGTFDINEVKARGQN